MLITGQQSKQARESLNISQNKTAQGADINRGYLSLFEAGKFEMPEYYLKQLIAFYENKGYVFAGKTLNSQGLNIYANDGMITDNHVIEDEYLEEDGEDGYTFDNDNDIKVDIVKAVQSEKQENIETSEIHETSNKGAVAAVALVGTVVFLWSVAERNGFDVFDWVKSIFSKKPKQNINDVFPGNYY